jgi:hypothetical protein
MILTPFLVKPSLSKRLISTKKNQHSEVCGSKANFEPKIFTMYSTLLEIHSLLRYFVLLSLLVVIIQSVIGMNGNKPFGKWDNKFSLYLLIFTHLQLLVGLILYFVSPNVRFGGGVMADKMARYWTVEHIFGMLVAVTLITIARITSKRMATDQAKFKRLAIFNFVALVVIIAIVWLSGRGLLTMTTL